MYVCNGGYLSARGPAEQRQHIPRKQCGGILCCSYSYSCSCTCIRFDVTIEPVCQGLRRHSSLAHDECSTKCAIGFKQKALSRGERLAILIETLVLTQRRRVCRIRRDASFHTHIHTRFGGR